jgi:dimeric dUTPase (all-alpha-NTP-PPase superfamily)
MIDLYGKINPSHFMPPTMITEPQLDSMLELQDGMNTRVDPEWVAANNDWYRAIQIEGVEAIEHHGWKWWKKQNLDMAQLRMELVDIWHFIMSAAIQKKHGNITLAKLDMMAEFNLHQKSVLFDNQYYLLVQMKLLDKLNLLVGLASAKRINLALFSSLLSDCGMTWADLFKQYVGKNVLNIFRQDHGYKSGTYINVWNGREDNEHLIEFLEFIDPDSDNVRNALYQSLKTRYAESQEIR